MSLVKKSLNRRAVSMKVLLVLCLLLMAVIPPLIQSQLFISSVRTNQITTKTIEVQNQCSILSNKLTRAGYLRGDTKNTSLDNEMDITADLFNGRIVIVNKSFRIVNDTFDLAVGKMNVAEEVLKCFKGESGSVFNEDKQYFALTLPIFDNTPEKGIDGVMVVSASTENMISMADVLSQKTRLFWMILLAAALTLAVIIARLLMAPYHRLAAKLKRVADGELDTDIREDYYRETREISENIELTLSQLKAVDQSRQEFVSNVSHELKTPITSIRVLADSLMGMEGAPVELYQEFMKDISDEIDRESKIIDDLLTLVKMDKSATELNVAQISINGLMELILKRLRPIAKKRNIELIFESKREVDAEVDEVKLSLALNNLVENAVKYNVEDGWVRVTLDADHKFFYVKVSDSGIGIPEEFQEHVFERFYRVDKARSRETGGTGLGLAITRSVILMHQGAIKLDSKEGEGTTFTVRIPLKYIP